jgi:hypothetical protein
MKYFFIVAAFAIGICVASADSSYSLIYSDGSNMNVPANVNGQPLITTNSVNASIANALGNYTTTNTINSNELDAATWNIATNYPNGYGSNVRSGTMAVTSLLSSTNVTFTSPLSSTNYTILPCTVKGNLGVFGLPTNITTNGFTLNFTVGITSTLGYLCVLNQ